MPTSSAGFFTRGGLGLPSHIVKLTAYNPHWPELFKEEKRRILALLDVPAAQIEHIGSTSVPGMDAKPVIDIMLGIPGPDHIDAAEAALARRGYICHGEKGIPGRLFFTYGEPPTLHLHMVTYTGPIWHGHLLFRETLRRDRALADEYVALKLGLANQFPLDRPSYTAGKSDFIEHVLRIARGEAAGGFVIEKDTPPV